jgi:molybdopterin converting factor small subunit
MAIKVKLFGILAEKAGKTALEWENAPTLQDLASQLKESFPALGETVWIMALNQTIEHQMNTPLKDGDEVALMPPFAGG